MDAAFRAMRRDDLPLADAWLAEPHVAAWWPEASLGIGAASVLGPAIDGEDPMEVFVVEWAGRPIGIVQRYRMADEPAFAAALAAALSTGPGSGAGPLGGFEVDRAVGIDYLIGDPTAVGVGIGPRALEAFAAGTFDAHPDVEGIVVGVQQGNRRSWRALEKCGFTRVYAGIVDSGDPSDAGPGYVYLRRR